MGKAPSFETQQAPAAGERAGLDGDGSDDGNGDDEPVTFSPDDRTGDWQVVPQKRE